jgi:hypothetical protein
MLSPMLLLGSSPTDAAIGTLLGSMGAQQPF